MLPRSGVPYKPYRRYPLHNQCRQRKSGCGSSVCLSVSGSTMVDEVVGYACGGSEPDLTELSCGSVTPSVNVSTEQCGCSGKTNVTVYGCFEFSNLPSLM